MRFLPTERNNRWGLGFFDDLDDFFTPFFERNRADHIKVDISEKDGNYILEMDVPGYDKKDISIELDNGYLTVKANKQEETDEKDKNQNYIKRERKRYACTRSFYVGDVKEDSIKPSLENGILKITFPKVEPESTKKQIPIK